MICGFWRCSLRGLPAGPGQPWRVSGQSCRSGRWRQGHRRAPATRGWCVCGRGLARARWRPHRRCPVNGQGCHGSGVSAVRSRGSPLGGGGGRACCRGESSLEATLCCGFGERVVLAFPVVVKVRDHYAPGPALSSSS